MRGEVLDDEDDASAKGSGLYKNSERGLKTSAEYNPDLGTVRVFRQKFTLEDAIGSHACSLDANMLVTNGIPLGSSLLLPVHTVNCVQTLKARQRAKTGWCYSTLCPVAMVRCAFSDSNPHSTMPLVPTPSRLKRAGV
jgi:hypothetical protein